jgi:hypothetical protein
MGALLYLHHMKRRALTKRVELFKHSLIEALAIYVLVVLVTAMHTLGSASAPLHR